MWIPGNAQIPVMIKHVSDKLKNYQMAEYTGKGFCFSGTGKTCKGC